MDRGRARGDCVNEESGCCDLGTQGSHLPDSRGQDSESEECNRNLNYRITHREGLITM